MTNQGTLTEKDAEISEYYLHYIGKQLYGVTRFVAEARRIGAQRTVTFGILKNLHYGDKILLAEHTKIDQINQATGEKLEPIPTAIVFGYLQVTGMTHNLPADLSEKLLQRLHVEAVETPEQAGATSEQRACGSYGIGSIAYVKEDIPDICTAIFNVCKENNVNPERKPCKFFVRGNVTTFERPIVLENTKFTRMYLKLKVDRATFPKVEQGEKPKGAIFQIYDYSRRRYMTREAGKDYDRALVDEYSEKVGGQ